MNTPRADLARLQHETLKKILHGAKTHAGKNLADKRRRELARAIPEVTQALGKRFPPLFTEYAAKVGYPKRGGPLTDGVHFCTWLLRSRKLPLDLAPLVQAVYTRHRWSLTLARLRKIRHLSWQGRIVKFL